MVMTGLELLYLSSNNYLLTRSMVLAMIMTLRILVAQAGLPNANV